MTRIRSVTTAAAALLLAVAQLAGQAPGTRPTVEQFLSAAYPFNLVSARDTDRLAWIAYDQGRRNVYTAAAPDFRPVRLTDFPDDDGVDLSDLSISDDGSTVVFVRGHAPNRAGWVANPSSHPDGGERALWAVRTSGGAAWKVVDAANVELAPDGSAVIFARDGQIHRALVDPPASSTPRDRGLEPFIRAWGTNGSPRWSPDGSRIAFVSNRTDHSYVVVYDLATRSLRYMAPGVDRDSSPAWSEDGRRLAFIRRPGLAFGEQSQQGGGGIGLPDGPAFGRGRAGGGRGGRGGRGGGGEGAPVNDTPGLMDAAFRGGYTMSIWVGDPETGEAHEAWHTTADERVFTRINTIRWASGHAVFSVNVPDDEWDRYFSVDLSGPPTDEPVPLTTTDGIIEDASSVALSKDGRTLFYTTNHGDIDRRHVWNVPVAGGTPRRLSPGDGIETAPMPLASGEWFGALTADARRPQSVGVFSVSTGEQRVIFPELPAEFPIHAHVQPTAVTLKASDDFEFYNQIFLPPDLQPGERRPAMIFVHGGPVRQMLLGYHYRHFYHMAYGVNQWLANQGYVVLSVNYRSGVGYGNSFRRAPNTGGRGNAEYLDVLAAGQYLQSRPDVDPDRVGIWGLSYGGVLTAQALARNSDIFKAGIDLAGVHLWGSSLDPESVSYQSSAVSAISSWTSPVLLVHGDDDRNVAFQQTTGLVQLLRAHEVPYELIVFPDDVHDSLIHARWVYTFERVDQFLRVNLPVGDRTP